MPGLLDGLLEAGRGVLEQQAGEVLERVGQDVLDSVIDKALESSTEAVKQAGLDPLPVPDINVPYSLDRVSGACLPLLKVSQSPAAKILAELLSCVAKNIEVEGDLTLTEGLLAGLSKLVRSKPTQISVSDGLVTLASSLEVTGLTCPFTVTNSNPNIEIPKIAAGVEKINVECGVKIPLSRDGATDGNIGFVPPLEELPIDLDMDLGELGPLEGVLRPLIIDPVRKRLVAALRDEVTGIVKEKVRKIGLSSLIQ